MKRAIWGREQGVALRWIGAAILALAVACAGCSALLPKLETPRLSLVGVKLQDMTYFEQRLLVRLLVKNPNDMALPIKGINVSFQLAGEDFAEGVSARAFDVPAPGVVFVDRAGIHLTTSGKVQRASMRSAFLNGELTDVVHEEQLR